MRAKEEMEGFDDLGIPLSEYLHHVFPFPCFQTMKTPRDSGQDLSFMSVCHLFPAQVSVGLNYELYFSICG